MKINGHSFKILPSMAGLDTLNLRRSCSKFSVKIAHGWTQQRGGVIEMCSPITASGGK